MGSFGNLASLGSRMNGKWKLHGERTTLFRVFQNIKLMFSWSSMSSKAQTDLMHLARNLTMAKNHFGSF